MVALLAIFFVACGPPAIAPDPQKQAQNALTANGFDVIATDAGVVRGARAGDTLAFKGIPYAAPPVGENRWRAPQPIARWEGIRDATHFGSGCVEIDLPLGKVKQGNEDCLTLNVWTPIVENGARSPLPVLVFLHGGYNVYGSSAHTVEDRFAYDGEQIAARGPAVFVTINYRLGALGFLASKALGTKGNFALLDQIAALSWVKKNISAFGGDPAHVMLFGHSAGAVNTCALVASPRAKGLFSSAIMHSGTCVATPLERAEAGGDELVAKLGCDQDANVGACMRSRDAYAVAEALVPHFTPGAFHWSPTIDGDILTSSIWNMIKNDRHNDVPVIIGVTADEMTTLVRRVSTKKLETEDDEKEYLRDFFGEQADAVAAHYPVSEFPTPRDAFIAAATDSGEVCPARRTARLFSVKSDSPVRRFFYTHTIDEGSAKVQRAGHGFDILMLFRGGPYSYYRPTAAERALSDAMIGYWTRFAKTGDPNGAGAVEWPAVTRDHDRALVLDENIHATDDVREKKCDFWDPLVK